MLVIELLPVIEPSMTVKELLAEFEVQDAVAQVPSAALPSVTPSARTVHPQPAIVIPSAVSHLTVIWSLDGAVPAIFR